jgi:hypothetical protein
VAVNLLDAGSAELGRDRSGEGASLSLGFDASGDPDALVYSVVSEDCGVRDTPGDDVSAGRIFGPHGNRPAPDSRQVLNRRAILAGQHKAGESRTDGVVWHGDSFLAGGC